MREQQQTTMTSIDDDERERLKAWRATQIAFARRYANMPDYTVSYRGGFPYQKVADAVPLPDPAPNSNAVPTVAQTNAWARLKTLFGKSWDKYMTQRGQQ